MPESISGEKENNPQGEKSFKAIMRTNGPGQSAALLLDVIGALEAENIAYAIIGAFAVSFYGLVRASMDADAVISAKDRADNVENLISTLSQQGFKVTRRHGDRDDPVKGVINIEDAFHNRVDLLLGLKGMPQDVFSRTVESKFMDLPIKLISAEDLIAMKIFAGSQKDMSDVEGIFQVSQDKINIALLRKITAQYGSGTENKLDEFLRELETE